MNRQVICVAGLAIAALSTPAFSQIQLQSQPTGPLKRMNMNLATGVITPVVDSGGTIQALVNEVQTVDNSAFSGSFFTPGATDEFADYGFSTGSNGPVCEFTIGYATNEPDDLLAPPVSLVIAFYSNDAAGSGNCDGLVYSGTGLGTEVARFTVAGLPGDTTPGDGIADAYAFNIDLRGNGAGGFLLPEGGVAWSYEVASDVAATGPLLMTPAAAGCSAPAGNPAPGTSDCFDIFSPGGGGGACVGTFGFQTPNIASFWMQILQEEFPAPAATLRDNGTNTATLTAVVDTAVVGCLGAACPTVTIASAGSILDFWALSRTSVPGVPIGVDGDLLIGLPEILFLTGPAGAPLNVAGIPIACDFIGIEIFTQGGAVDATGQISLTNALDYVIGTP